MSHQLPDIKMYNFLVLSCIISIIHFAYSDPELYWRPFTGTVPKDAVPAAKDFGYNIYIGTAPYRDAGLFVSEVLPGINSINVAVPGLFGGSVHAVNQHMKILCSTMPDNFKWVAASYSTIHSIPGVVEGGYEGANVGTLYIGRAFVNNRMSVGKVVAYHVGDGQERRNILYIASENEEVEIDNFEVLTYDELATTAPSPTTTPASERLI